MDFEVKAPTELNEVSPLWEFATVLVALLPADFTVFEGENNIWIRKWSCSDLEFASLKDGKFCLFMRL